MTTRAAPFVLFALLVFPCGAQPVPLADPAAPEENSGIVPLSLVLEALWGDPGRWRPDWPPEIPPDAFAVGGAISIDLDLEDGEGGEGGENEIPVLGRYRLAWDSQGRPTDLPLALPMAGPGRDPVFVQARVRYGEGEGLTVIDIEAPPSERSPGSLSIRFEGPYDPGTLCPARVEYGDRLYHVRFHAGIHEITETWFDPWGVFSAHFRSRIEPSGGEDTPWRILGLEGAEYAREESGVFAPLALFAAAFFYESGGNLSEYYGEHGSFSAIYGGRPLYWSRGSRQFSLQWDQAGRLVRMRDSGGEEGLPVDFRYDYGFDSRGNWVLRRETALVRAGNLLVPAYSRVLVRRIVYDEGEGDGGID